MCFREEHHRLISCVSEVDDVIVSLLGCVKGKLSNQNEDAEEINKAKLNLSCFFFSGSWKM